MELATNSELGNTLTLSSWAHAWGMQEIVPELFLSQTLLMRKE
jgi:hypothetical protein